MDHIELIKDINYSYYIMSSYNNFITDENNADLDYMLFEAHEKKDIARDHIRRTVAEYINHQYQDDVSEFIASDKYLDAKYGYISNQFYQYMKTFSKIKGEFIDPILWMWSGENSNLDLIRCYHTMRENISNMGKETSVRVPEFKSAYDCVMLRWGEFIKTEIANDGFDYHIIMRKLLDLILTIVCMEYILN